MRCSRSTSFNGGPDNRPARPGRTSTDAASIIVLQWRAGQSSGQTNRPRGGPNCGDLLPSMEGRTIVRPDSTFRALLRALLLTFNGGPDNRPARHIRATTQISNNRSFNGGPDNRPARPSDGLGATGGGVHLQWRAGQSSGQTRPAWTATLCA